MSGSDVRTLGDLKTKIANQMMARTDLTTEIAQALVDAIKHHERRPFYFNTKTGTAAVVATDEYLDSTDLSDIPDIVEIMSATFTNSSSIKIPVRIIPFASIDDEQDGAVTGDPRFIAVFKQQLRLFPIASAAGTLNLAYVYRLSELSADGSTNAWTTDAEELIRSRAKWDLWQHTLYDAEKASMCKTAEAEALEALRAETRRRKGNMMLRTEVGALVNRPAFNINLGY